jgi:PAS domain S-box-containing protein
MEYTQQELMSFFNATDDVFFSADPVNLQLIRISKSCEKLYGYTVADFLNNYQLLFDLIHPDDQHIAANETHTLQRGEQVNSQYRIIRRDNTIRWIEKKAIPSLDEADAAIRINGVIRDITEHKEAEEKLKHSEVQYRQIVENAQEGIWTIDEHDKTNFVNKKICDILGYTPEEMMGKELFDFMDEAGKAYAIECMERRRRGAKENLDIRYMTKTGNTVWANISANPIFDEKGTYKGSLAMITDITQRKQDEEALKISEANLRTLFNNTDSSYILLNDQLEIVSFNGLAQTYSETVNNKLLEINKPIKDYFPEQHLLFINDVIERLKREGSVEYELSFIDNGVAKWHHVRWLTVKNNDDKTWGFILANKDITEAKLAVLEREKITNDLIKQNKDLEQFTYIISHNLRSPVANIMGLAELLTIPHAKPVSKDEVFEMVAESVKNLDTVIRDLNHILQVRKPMNEKKEMVFFKNVIASIDTSILNKATREHVTLTCDFDEVDSIYTIRSYLYSIFYNLISNSIKFRKPDIPAQISIKSYRYELNDKIEIHFKDNGKGIDLAKNTANLFGLYKRFDTSTEGKGMGLFMVKTQVEALGGTISINSKLGEGTAFVIQFGLSEN